MSRLLPPLTPSSFSPRPSPPLLSSSCCSSFSRQPQLTDTGDFFENRSLSLWNREHLTQLWTTKYAPQRLADICGNKSQVEKLKKWLENW